MIGYASRLASLLLSCACIAVAQTPPADQPLIFKSKVSVVAVPVVVRDKKGNAVGNLKAEDFQLFDRGKLQQLASFSMESAPGRLVETSVNARAATPVAPAKTRADKPSTEAPERFIAYYFDDLHMQAGDLLPARVATKRQIETSLRTTDRVAIFTSSGQNLQEFTDSREKLNSALNKLRVHPTVGQGMLGCPLMTYYMADQIQNKSNQEALSAVIADVMRCAQIPDAETAERRARSAASREMTVGDLDTRGALRVLDQLVRRMSTMPGQRSIVMVSGGFVTLAEHAIDKSEIIDRAARANVLVNALDARGLYTDLPDIARRSTSAEVERVLQKMDHDASRQRADVMAEMAAGTGGTFVENTNDLEGGLKRLAAVPEYYYLLGFSPPDLKADGAYHGLKVSLKGVRDVNISARRGYYSPRQAETPADGAKREIDAALYSREEMKDLPVELRTQVVKGNDGARRILLSAKVDVKNLRFRRDGERNCNDLTIVAGLFDRNGIYTSGIQKTVELRLLDATLKARLEGGLNIQSDFDVKPGTYAVRLVVRDAEGQLMTAQNGAVEIPE
ncbi:MAG: VWA domain-containing protein [Candidatus Solibacter sp.]